MKKLRYKLFMAQICILIFTGASGCAIRKLPDVPPKDISKYKSYQEQMSVRIAVDPYAEKDRLLEYFGDDILRTYGLLPVNIIVENQSKESIFAKREDIVLISPDNRVVTQESLGDAKMPMRKIIRENDQGMATAGAGICIFPCVIPFIFGAGTAVEMKKADLKTVMHNLDVKAMQEKVIYRGEKDHGFVYFILKDDLSKGATSRVRVKVKNLATDETYTFMFDVNLNAERRKIPETKNAQ